MTTDERVLASTVRPRVEQFANIPGSSALLERYRVAILAGTQLRQSGRDQGINRAQVREYTDPVDGAVRWAHTVQHLTDYDWADFPTQGAAVAVYEDRVRVLAATGWLYDETDVEGVAVVARLFCSGGCGGEVTVEYPVCWDDACPGAKVPS